MRPGRHFGTEQVWAHDARVAITDLERTLLDGLSRPRLCGDFAEVLHALEVAMDRVDIRRISAYAVRLGTATAKRLGWILAYCGCTSPEVDLLKELPPPRLPHARSDRIQKVKMQRPLSGSRESPGLVGE